MLGLIITVQETTRSAGSYPQKKLHFNLMFSLNLLPTDFQRKSSCDVGVAAAPPDSDSNIPIIPVHQGLSFVPGVGS